MALTTPNLELKEIMSIFDNCSVIASSQSSEWVKKDDMEVIFKKIDTIGTPEIDILLRLFTLFDVNGDDTVNFKDYLAGILGCITSAKIPEKLKSAISLYDKKESTNYCSKGDVRRVLVSVNNVASYFGDLVVSAQEIETCTVDAFKTLSAESGKGVSTDAVVEFLLQHPTIQTFLRGEGSIRYGLAETYPPIEEPTKKK